MSDKKEEKEEAMPCCKAGLPACYDPGACCPSGTAACCPPSSNNPQGSGQVGDTCDSDKGNCDCAPGFVCVYDRIDNASLCAASGLTKGKGPSSTGKKPSKRSLAKTIGIVIGVIIILIVVISLVI